MGEFHRRDDEGPENFFDRRGARRRCSFRSGQLFEPRSVDNRDPAGEHGLEQSLFRTEVIVDGGKIHFGRIDDVANAGSLESVVRKQTFGSVEYSFGRYRLSIIHTFVLIIRLN